MSLTKDELRIRHAELRDIVNEWDPIGVMSAPDWPRDEYEDLIGPILRRLESGATAPEIAAFLQHEITQHFGLDQRSEVSMEWAEQVRQWYDTRWRGKP